MIKHNLLIVDDEPNMLRSLEVILMSDDLNVLIASNGQEALAKLGGNPVHLVLTDSRMQGMDGFELMRRIKTGYPQIPIIMMTAYATPKLAVEAIKNGASDYISKPFDPEELIHIIKKNLQYLDLLSENQILKGKINRQYRVDNIVGEHPQIRRIRQLIQQVAASNASVLILGESGTGKELVAGALHTHSNRVANPFIRVNCAAIPETLLESELFGHEKGAFTGADKQRVGRFEEADGGTIFLDEIGDMPKSLQAKLLRVLEDGSFRRLGGTTDLRADVRIIAATNRDLEKAMVEKEFREDLYHRLNVVTIRTPSLRERKEDIPMLAEHFLMYFNRIASRKFSGFDPEAIALLKEYDWPGNIRELRNVIERATIMESTTMITAAVLPENLLTRKPAVQASGGGAQIKVEEIKSLQETLDQLERNIIIKTLKLHQGSINKTASHLAVSRHALRYRMQKLGIDSENLQEEPPKEG